MGVLRKGDQGPKVREASSLLVKKGLLEEPKDKFDTHMRRVIKVFQSRNLDSAGRPLEVDGLIGPLTMWALENDDITEVFERPIPEEFKSMPRNCAGTHVGRKALEYALEEMRKDAGEIGENNAGKFVAKYHKMTREEAAEVNYAWCAAFVSWCVEQAAEELGFEMPFRYTGGAQSILKQLKRDGQAYDADEELPKPGDIVVWKRGSQAWMGHVGIVYDCHDGIVHVVEGNRGAFPSKVRVYTYTLGKMKKLLGFARLPDIYKEEG